MMGISLAFILMIVVLGAVVAYKWVMKTTHLNPGEEGPDVRTLSGGRVKESRRKTSGGQSPAV